MRNFLAWISCTTRLMFWSLLPAGKGETAHCEGEGECRLAPRQIRGDLGRFLNSQGELRLFFPGCLPIAAPAVLFRLKRQGFSRCRVEASGRGLLVRGMR